MRTIFSTRLSALSFALLCAGATVRAGDHRESPQFVNRIVGLWSTEALVGPCGATPLTPIRNTLLFHAGGTVVENPRSPPGGVPNAAGIPGNYQRGQALGTWVYDPGSQRYFIHLRFDNFVDNAYHGYSTVDREITLTKRGTYAAGPVRSARYAANGTLISEVCGEAVSTPL